MKATENRYAAILRRCGLFDTARFLAEKYGSSSYDRTVLFACAPFIYLYAEWVINRAVKLGIKRLYFLARDSYSVLKAAQTICDRDNIDIKLSYFYCSRHSLRMAAYRFKDSSAYDRLFYECYRLTAANLLARAEFDLHERLRVYADVGFDTERENEILSKDEFHSLCASLKKSDVFNNILKEKSDAAYDNTIGYFRQEGLFDYDRIGIVDTGWTGSVQLAMKKLLLSAGVENTVTGFYIGMLEQPEQISGSEYINLLFEGKSDCGTKAWFSHNLMECILTAPHAMTVGYCFENGSYKPVFAGSAENVQAVRRMTDIVTDFAANVRNFSFDDSCIKAAKALMKKLMFHPDKESAEAFSQYKFCDDFSESYQLSLVKKADKEELSGGYIHKAILHKSDGKRLLWYYGSLAVTDVGFKRLRSMMYYLSQYARYFALRLR